MEHECFNKLMWRGGRVLANRIACIHCCAKHLCPQAGAMGVRQL